MVDLKSLVMALFSPEDILKASDLPRLPGEEMSRQPLPLTWAQAPNLTQQGLRRNHPRPLLLLRAARRISPSALVGLFQAGPGLPAKSPFN